ncbi:MAG: OmpA family protein [Betaproteobacteria bacterium]|nr:OmpA family protein [Betaproteobacteria bacterium]
MSFGFDSAEPPRAEIDAVLAAVAEPLRAHAEAKVVVQGYADAAGTDQYNLLLSYRRAKAVATRLGEGGIAAQRIAIRAAGSHEPIAGLPPAAEQNRRATVQVRGFEGCR